MPPAGACRTGPCRTPRRSRQRLPPMRRSAAASPIQAFSPWAAAPARGPARTPCEAEKTSRDPGLASLRFDLAIASLVTGLDKSQVFAFVLNCRKLFEKAERFDSA